MKILIACEESQAVCKAFRELGHEAYSCDIEPCSGGHPEWHIQDDVLCYINGHCIFETCNGAKHIIPKRWDIIIAFPPCTYLTCTGNKWFKEEYKDRFPTRVYDREDAIRFFMCFANANCLRIAIENPVGIMSTKYRKPDQIIHPYMFGNPEREKKRTCLWLKGLSQLYPTNIVHPKIIKYKNNEKTDSPWHMNTINLPPKERAKVRSKTFPGIARAMALQWGCNGHIINLKNNTLEIEFK